MRHDHIHPRQRVITQYEPNPHEEPFQRDPAPTRLEKAIDLLIFIGAVTIIAYCIGCAMYVSYTFGPLLYT